MNQDKTVRHAKVWGAITALLLAGILFVFFGNFSKNEYGNPLREINFGVTLTNENLEVSARPISPDSVSYDKTYTHPSGLSFSYPSEWTVGTFPEGEDGEIIVIQDSKRTIGFQIYMSAFDDENTALTSERLLQEIPDLVIEEPQQITVTGEGTGITFISDYGSGKTREVWFVYKRHLYQLSAPLTAQGIVQEVLKTWKF